MVCDHVTIELSERCMQLVMAVRRREIIIIWAMALSQMIRASMVRSFQAHDTDRPLH